MLKATRNEQTNFMDQLLAGTLILWVLAVVLVLHWSVVFSGDFDIPGNGTTKFIMCNIKNIMLMYIMKGSR